MDGYNWSGTLRYRAREVVRASTVEDVARALSGTGAVRALGTRHSFSAVADTDGVQIDVTGLPAEPELDLDRREVRIGAGARYADVAVFLQQNGWALANMGSLPHISVGGAIATGTHGSGVSLANLSASVRELELVTADGSILRLRQGDPEFDGAVVGLGALGVVVRIGLAIEPSYQVRQDLYDPLEWDVFLADPLAVMGAAYSVCLFTDWVSTTVNEVLVKHRVSETAPEPPERIAGAQRLTSEQLRHRLEVNPRDNWTECGTVGPWCDRLPHFRIDATPSLGEELQTEYFVPLSMAADALAAMRSIGPQLAGPLLITELRTVAADDLWLSPCFRRDSLAIHFTWYRQPAEVARLLPLIERTLAPFAPRPHWGKVFDDEALDVATCYPRAADFRRLAERLDPAGRFRNDYLLRTVWR